MDRLPERRESAPPVRGTQSFVGTVSTVWKRPSLTAMEVAWRWLFGIPALLLTWSQVRPVLLTATHGTMDPGSLGLDPALLNDPVGALTADPMGAAGKFASALHLVLPGLEHVAVWLMPLLALAWVWACAAGRTVWLRRYHPALHVRVATVAGLQAIRLLVLAAVFWLWVQVVLFSSQLNITRPIASHAEPNLVLFCAMLIVGTLALFTAWGFVSWIFTLAPLLAMERNAGVLASLTAALRAGPERGRLIEVNLVMGIVKLALLVLALVFSATPLPFQSVTTTGFLLVWSGVVCIFYLLWSDLFHVARQLAYLPPHPSKW